jgi:hypothetical protein
MLKQYRHQTHRLLALIQASRQEIQAEEILVIKASLGKWGDINSESRRYFKE